MTDPNSNVGKPRNEWNRFLRRCLIFMALQGLILLGLILSRDTSEESNYLAVTLDKHQRLATVQGPKLVLVGGSNVAFGFMSDTMEITLERTVVNMGLVGGLGIPFMLNEVDAALNSGDVVVLSFEYELFSGSPNRFVLLQVLEYSPSHLFHLSAPDLRPVVLDNGLSLLGALVRRSTPWYRAPASDLANAPYLRSAFNLQGDMIGHHDLAPRTEGGWGLKVGVPGAANRTLPAEVSPEIRRFLDRFVRRCRDRNVRVCLTFPPYPESIFGQVADTLESLARSLDAIAGLEILDVPAETVFPDALFFDTGYHLTREGAEQRTRHVLDRLALLPNADR